MADDAGGGAGAFDMAKVARLARLHLSDEEQQRLGEQLHHVLGHIAALSALDVSGVEPLAHPLPLRNSFRDDEQRPSLPPGEALGNTAKRAGDFYAVPAILEGS